MQNQICKKCGKSFIPYKKYTTNKSFSYEREICKECLTKLQNTNEIDNIEDYMLNINSKNSNKKIFYDYKEISEKKYFIFENKIITLSNTIFSKLNLECIDFNDNEINSLKNKAINLEKELNKIKKQLRIEINKKGIDKVIEKSLLNEIRL